MMPGGKPVTAVPGLHSQAARHCESRQVLVTVEPLSTANTPAAPSTGATSGLAVAAPTQGTPQQIPTPGRWEGSWTCYIRRSGPLHCDR